MFLVFYTTSDTATQTSSLANMKSTTSTTSTASLMQTHPPTIMGYHKHTSHHQIPPTPIPLSHIPKTRVVDPQNIFQIPPIILVDRIGPDMVDAGISLSTYQS